MRTAWIYLVVAAMLLVASNGCGPSTSDGDGDSDADSDTDTDVDTDVDSDSDTDVDTDSDGDGDGDGDEDTDGGGECLDDTFEENDTEATALPLTEGGFDRIMACPGDDDYYAVDLAVGDQIQVDLTFSHADGDVDLYLVDPDGLIAAASDSVTDDESVTHTAESAGTYLVVVTLAGETDTEPGAQYDMDITVEEGVPTCRDDSFEDNDTPLRATSVGAGAYAGLRQCPGDDDFYAIDLAVGDRLDVSLTFSNAEGNIDLDVIAPDRSVVASGTSTTDDESVTHVATMAGTYLLMVMLTADAGSVEGNDYDLSIVVTPGTPTCADDGFEDNDTLATAAVVAAGAYPALRSCPGDDDYYSVDLNVGDELTVDLAFATAEGNVDLVLTDPTGVTVATSTTATDDESVTHVAALSGSYVARVYLEADAGSVEGNDYDMTVAVVEPTPTCTDDGYEDNDTVATAAAVAAGTYGGLRVCPGDDDFYSIALGLGDELTVNLDFSDAEGDVDLRLLDPTGTTVASSSSTTDDESITYTATDPGTYSIRVYLFADDGSVAGNDYDMVVIHTPATPVCAEDGYEDNDTQATAVAVGAGTYPGLRICPSDDDYFAIDLGAGDELTVNLDFTDAEGDIDLRLLSSAGATVASATSTTDDESLTYTAPAAGTYAIRAYLFADAGATEGNDYSMQIIHTPATPVCTDDGYEDNDTQATASAISAGDYTGLRICPGDDDYFSIGLGVGDELTVTLDFTDAEGDIDLRLLSSAGATVAASTSTTDDESITYTAVAAGTYTIRANLFADAGGTPGNGYDMHVVHTPATPVCTEDAFEDNDSQATAATVAAGSYPGLRSCPSDLDYYDFYLGVDDELTVTLTFLDSEGDIDLRLLNAAGTTVAASTSMTDNETITYTATAAGTYTIRVNLYADAGSSEGNSYDMSIVHTPATPVCAEDAYEENDTQATAAAVGPGTYPDLRSCPSDLDYYAIDLAVGDTIDIDLFFVDAEGDIDLRLLNAAGTTVAAATSTTDDETITYTATTAGTYAIRVDLFADAGGTLGNDYEMTVAVTYAYDPCADDGFEENDSTGAAADVGAGFFADLWVCPTDVDDYYGIGLGAGDEISVDLYFTDAEGDIDLRLLNPAGTAVASSLSTTDDESLTHTAAAAGGYYIRASLYADAGSVTGNSYDMDVWVTRVDGCLQDGFEENDTQAAAVFIGAAYYYDLWVCPSDTNDYFDVWLESGEEIWVDIYFTDAEGDVDLRLLNASGTTLVSSASTTDDEAVHYVAPSAGYYTIRVNLFADAGSTTGNFYDMDVYVL